MYYGITIGPIVETISKAQKTIEIWGASYLFSKMMKKIAYELKKQNVKFIIPFVEGEYQENDNGIGMYHDRIIFESDKLTIDDVNEIITNIKSTFAKDIANTLKEDEKKVNDYFQKYIKTYVVEVENCQNPILDIYKILDNIEYNDEIYEYEDFIDRFFIRDNILKSNLKKKSGVKGFDSIPQIASKETNIDLGYMDDDSDYYEELQNKLKDNFKQVYKYIAIVHADGDRLGNVVKSIKDFSGDNPVSKALFEFGEKSKELLKEYSCNTIFIGGDDLLFFAPVIMKVKNKEDKIEDKTIFDLLDELKDAYSKAFEFYNNEAEKQTTLSFGVSITYYKFPLSEALNLSKYSLFGKAKKKKNAVAISVRKHSGQMNELIVSFDDDRYSLFKNLLKDVLNDKADLPFSIHYKLKDLEELLELIDNFDSFFDNYFNEDIHKNKFKKGLNYIKSIIENSPNNRLEVAFPATNIIKLLKGKK